MSEQVVLPALGESVTEGTVTRWLKKVGDTVAVDEPLVEVSTDKVDTEIPSPVAGVIEQILVQEDETVQVGAVLVVIGSGSGAAAPAAAPVAEAPVAPAPIAETPAPVAAPESPAAPLAAPVSAPVSAPVAPPVAAPVAPVAAPSTPTTSPTPTNVDAGYVTPLVRKLASEIGIDLSKIAGTGVGGRIRKDDVLAASSAPAAAPIAFAAPVAASAPATTFVPGAASPLRGTTEPMSRLRKVLAERAVASMVSTAQLTTVVEVDVTKIAALRSRVQAQFVAATGGKLNFMPFFALAAAEALRVHPKLNATIDGENIVYHGTENISFAVDTEKGLLTPVIRDASTLNIAQIA
ncbi:MAG: hypothetical protein RLZZ404_739, partial [Actinomycetota bacterium]